MAQADNACGRPVPRSAVAVWYFASGHVETYDYV